MEKINNHLKKLAGKVLLLAAFLILALASKATDNRDSLIDIYSLRLAHKLDSLIAINAKNDASGKSRLNNYILRLGSGMEEADDNTGFLRQPEIQDGNGKKVSFLGNEVNETKMNGYETELATINSTCPTHKSYLILIGNIPVEFENIVEDNQWSNIVMFFESKGSKADSLKEKYKKILFERQDFYQKVLDRVRQQIGTSGGTPLAIYNIYSYRLTVKMGGPASLLSYLHMDCYGNFAERETFAAIKRANWKKFNWQSNFRSDFVESAIAMIKQNNGDYKNMGDFFGAGLAASLDGLYNAMLAKKSVGETDQAAVLGQNELASLLTELNEAAFGRLTLDQRVKLLKILTYGNALANSYEHALLYTVKTVPDADVPALFDALKTVNPLRIDGGVILYGLVKTMEDESDTYLVGGMQPGNDNNMLTSFMKELTKLYAKLTDSRKEAIYNDIQANANNRCFIWDYGWTDTRAMQMAADKGAAPIGAMSYDVEMEKNGSLKITWKALDGITWYRMPGNDGDPGRPFPHFSNPSTFTIADPLALVIFGNRSDLGIVIPNGNTNTGAGSTPDNMVSFVPAVFLQYAMRKQINKMNEDRIGNALTALNIAVPYTRLLTIIKSAGIVQKIFAGTQLISTAASATKIAALATPLSGDSTFNKVIGYLEMVGVVNIFNIKAGVGTVRNIANVDNTVAVMGNFVASIENDATVYNRLYQMAYGASGATAEQKAAAQMLVHLKDEIKFKGETVFGKEFWKRFAAAGGLADAGANTRVLRLFEQTGLYSTQVTDNVLGAFKVSTKNGNRVLAEVDITGVAQLKENTTLANGLTEVDAIKVKYKRQGAAVTEEDILLCANKADGSSCLIAGYCFVAGTPVAVPGGLKNIETIQEGDEVISKDVREGKNTIQRVTAVTKRTAQKLVRLVTEKETVLTTPEHPFYVENTGWTLAEKLRKGIRLVTLSGAMVLLTDMQAFDSSATVYNFEVPQTHNYYVGNQQLLAHNTEVCKALIAKMAGKLGTGYEEMETVIKDIAARYKELSRLSEEAAFAKLEQLCSDAITKQELQGLFSNLKSNALLKERFVTELVKYDDLLSQFANNGKKITAWVNKFKVIIKIDNYTNLAAWVNRFDGIEDAVLLAKIENLSPDKLSKLDDLYSPSKFQMTAGGNRLPVNSPVPYQASIDGKTVFYNRQGFADFKPYSAGDEFVFTSNNLTGGSADFTQANNWAKSIFDEDKFRRIGNSTKCLIKINGTWLEHTWHHYQDGKKIFPVRTDIHAGFRHTGGKAIIDRGLQGIFE